MRTRVLLFLSLSVCLCAPTAGAQQPTLQQLSTTAEPYIKYFADRALDDVSAFEGLTRSFQLSLEPPQSSNETVALYGAAAYDMSILGHLQLGGGNTAVLDTYINYFHMLSDPLNPLYHTQGDYTDDMLNPINNGPFRLVRILGRGFPNWGDTWDFVVDTGAAATLTMYALDAYENQGDPDYLALTGTLAEYVLRLVDTDGAIRFGPIGMFHPSGLNFFWNLKSTEQNLRVMYMMDALHQVTGIQTYLDTADGIRAWLKTMYDFSAHLFCEASIYDGISWNKVTVASGASPTDVTAFAPLRMMLEDPFFGATLADRSQEVDDMFDAIEQRNAFFDAQDRPLLFRFSVGQENQLFGSIEWSSQMAMAYLRAVALFTEFGDPVRAAFYQDRYDTLVANLESLFSPAPDDAASLIASYAVLEDGSPAGSVMTGIGFNTIHSEAALAAAWFAFAKAGFDPTILAVDSSINYGDVNDDGMVTSIDASQVARHVVGLIVLTPDAVLRGEVSGDGILSSIDASLIARYAVGLITEFPVETP